MFFNDFFYSLKIDLNINDKLLKLCCLLNKNIFKNLKTKTIFNLKIYFNNLVKIMQKLNKKTKKNLKVFANILIKKN